MYKRCMREVHVHEVYKREVHIIHEGCTREVHVHDRREVHVHKSCTREDGAH